MSRRPKLIPGLRAAPLALGEWGEGDPALPLARRWFIGQDEAWALLAEWNLVEDRLMRADAPADGRALAGVGRRQEALERDLDGVVRRLVAQRATTPVGALAKIEVALGRMEPGDVEPALRRLVLGGYLDLRALLIREKGS